MGCRSEDDISDTRCDKAVSVGSKRIAGHHLEPGVAYLACLFPSCPQCPRGYSTLATCFTFRTAPHGRLIFHAVEYSRFLVGVEWKGSNIRPTSKYTGAGFLEVLACWSDQPCVFRCARDQVLASAGAYTMPTDLSRFSVYVELRRSRKPFFYAFFERRTLEPSPPCDASVSPYGPSAVRLSWLPWGRRFHGYQVSWCRVLGKCTSVLLPRNATSVIVKDLPPFERYHYYIQSFRSYSNSSDIIYSERAAAVWKVRTSFEMVMYLKMLVEFLMAAILVLGASLLLGSVVALLIRRGRGTAAENDDEVEADARAAEEAASQGGDHRRPRRRPHGPPRVHSRGDC